jgi:flagellum-specific peptidoglycan hydrolase FlgJ
MNDAQRQFLERATSEAVKANHPFPRMAACEAALESFWGNSALARTANNLFGMKQHEHPICGTIALPTKEFLDGQWKACTAEWVSYPDWRACFCDRLATLERLSTKTDATGKLRFPHYAAALKATDPQTYVTEVSRTWSTDPDRAHKVISIYQAFIAGAAPARS